MNEPQASTTTTQERNPFIRAEHVSPGGTRVKILSVSEHNSPARPATFEKKATKEFHGLMVNVLLEGQKLCLPVRYQSIDYNNVISQMKTNDFWQWEGQELFVIRVTSSAGSYVNVIRFDANGRPDLPQNDKPAPHTVNTNPVAETRHQMEKMPVRELRQDQLIEALHFKAAAYGDQRSTESLMFEALARILKVTLRM
jgi:hypothetical protein